MNQPTHAWLAVEAYRKIEKASATSEGKKKKLDGLVKLLGKNLRDVVVAAWLPDSLIKDMSYGHVFKNSVYTGGQTTRFTLSKADLQKNLSPEFLAPGIAFDRIDSSWWTVAYRVKENGGHLPARVNALCQTARDMLKMGDKDVVKLTGIKLDGSKIISDSVLSSPRDIAIMMWMLSHYVADAHMPFHSDNRALASSNKDNKAHSGIETIWGKQVSKLFHVKSILKQTPKQILEAQPPKGSKFAGIDFGKDIGVLVNKSDPWLEAVYLCRMGFAVSFSMIPPSVAAVDDRITTVTMDDILDPNGFCGEDLFWELSRAIMNDAVNSIARFWQDIWVDFTAKKK